jgi:SAM-dependent methyltransferase
MCNKACLAFGKTILSEADVQGKHVIEVGAFNVNGSMRSIVEELHPERYLGVDIFPGPGVDEICAAEDLVAHFGAETFDLVISTEMIEHVRDWRIVLSNLKQLVRPHGILLITTRAQGFSYHGCPGDFWRYELNDIRILCADFNIEALQPDPKQPGVFLKARKPEGFIEHDLRSYALYSIINKKRCLSIHDWEIWRFLLYWKGKDFVPEWLKARIKKILKFIKKIKG